MVVKISLHNTGRRQSKPGKALAAQRPRMSEPVQSLATRAFMVLMATIGLMGAMAVQTVAQERLAVSAPASTANPSAPASTSASAAANAAPPITAQTRIAVGGVAAIVNDEAISKQDVRLRARLATASLGTQPNAEALAQLSAQILETLIDERLQLQEAKVRKISATEDDVDKAFSELAESNRTTPEQLAGELRRLGANPRTLRDQLKADFVWQNLVQGRYGALVRVSESDMHNMMEQMKDAMSKTQYQLSEIVIPVNSPEDEPRALAFANRLLDDMRKGTAFDVTAKHFSNAPSAAGGGNLGWVSSEGLRPEVIDIVEQMSAGDVSNPIPTPAGIYIVQLRDKREGAKAAQFVSLKQIVASIDNNLDDEGKAALFASMGVARDRIKSCDDVAASTEGLPGLVSVDLGDNPEDQLRVEFQVAITGLERNQVSQPFITEGAMHIVVVCGRRTDQNEAAPTRQEVENRLLNEQLQVLAQAYLRDLRRSAAILRR